MSLFLMAIHYANFVLWIGFYNDYLVCKCKNFFQIHVSFMTCDEVKLMNRPWNVFLLFFCFLKSIQYHPDMIDGSQYH
jgi:hypothetical protein